MIAKIASRDSANCAVVYAIGSYDYGLLDAGTAGTATLVVSEGASEMDYDIIKPGSFVHIFPQYNFDHWYGLVTSEPTFSPSNRTYTIQATELHAFLGDIASVVSFVPVAGSTSADESTVR